VVILQNCMSPTIAQFSVSVLIHGQFLTLVSAKLKKYLNNHLYIMGIRFRTYFRFHLLYYNEISLYGKKHYRRKYSNLPPSNVYYISVACIVVNCIAFKNYCGHLVSTYILICISLLPSHLIIFNFLSAQHLFR